ncbi:homoserine acetyltransferase family protein [Violaceomyces palustris]|uniref:Homoserine acetyltransferase family protein n=1 Tax=Violaceomyces palustris TaxID=1673888 RepID=A0ACD0P5X9_9BASI|nr:homoserine acetyltransferase family protein [Violaceomyces palustris]
MTGPPIQKDPNVETYSLGDFELQSGEVLPDAYVAYRTYGNVKNPCIVYPTWFSGTITAGNEWLISTQDHPRKALDPSRYFIICPALFGNGESTSPSNTTGPKGGRNLPKTTFYDNVRAQHELVTKKFGIEKVIVTGWSMGAGQAFQWACQYPDMVTHCIPFCGSARTSIHNWVFLEAVKGAIRLDPDFQDGDYMDKLGSQPVRGLRAMGRVYAGWGFSQTFYRMDGFRKYYGFKNVEEVMVEFWEKWSTSKDANNLLHHLFTWQHGDIGAQPLYAGESLRDKAVDSGGRFGVRGAGGVVGEQDERAFERALKGIKAKTLIMPCRTDLYFPPEDSEIEANYMGEGKATLKVIESFWGHWSGGPGDSKEDAEWIDQQIHEFLQES